MSVVRLITGKLCGFGSGRLRKHRAAAGWGREDGRPKVGLHFDELPSKDLLVFKIFLSTKIEVKK